MFTGLRPSRKPRWVRLLPHRPLRLPLSQQGHRSRRRRSWALTMRSKRTPQTTAKVRQTDTNWSSVLAHYFHSLHLSRTALQWLPGLLSLLLSAILLLCPPWTCVIVVTSRLFGCSSCSSICIALCTNCGPPHLLCVCAILLKITHLTQIYVQWNTPTTNVTLASKTCLSPAGRVIVVRTKKILMSHLGKHIQLQVEPLQTITE